METQTQIPSVLFYFLPIGMECGYVDYEMKRASLLAEIKTNKK